MGRKEEADAREKATGMRQSGGAMIAMMKEIEIYYLRACPYCRNAQKAAEALLAARPEFSALSIRWIEERENPALAEARDYYYVPSVFFGDEKLYEASPSDNYTDIYAHLEAAFQTALA